MWGLFYLVGFQTAIAWLRGANRPVSDFQAGLICRFQTACRCRIAHSPPWMFGFVPLGIHRQQSAGFAQNGSLLRIHVLNPLITARLVQRQLIYRN